MQTAPYTKAYLALGRQASDFAKMVADFHSMGSGEFLKAHPDYDYNGTDHIVRRARKLAEALTAYADEFRSGQMREAEKAAA